MSDNAQKVEFVRGLGVISAANIVIGSMIGSGIFLAPSIMAGYIQTPGLLILLWLICGMLTMFASLSMSELASSFPHTGGQYVYLREAFSPLFGFLYGWTLFTVIQSGFIAAVAIAFAKFLGVFLPVLGEQNVLLKVPLHGAFTFSFSSAQLVSLAVIIALTAINMRGVKAGALVQNIFTFSKLSAILFLVGAALLLGKSHGGNLGNFLPLVKPIVPSAINMTLFAALAVAMSKALFAYDAWTSVTYVAEEIKDPKRNIPRALFMGTGITTIVYTLTVFAYIYIIPLSTMSDLAKVPENRIGAIVAQSLMGGFGLIFITIAVLISTLGCVNGLVLSGPRLYYAMAHDGLFFKNAALINPATKTPNHALIYQGIWSCILVVSGSYNALLTYTTFASLLFNAMTIIGLFKLRRTRPDLPRPYKVFGYPFVPLIYVLVAIFFIIFVIQGDPKSSLAGVACILIGIPIYLFWKKQAAALKK